MAPRIIARLDIKGPNLIKGIHLEGLRTLGTPEVFARHYYQEGIDELLYIDAVASLYQRNSLHDIVSKTAKEIFIPLTVGGGIRTCDDIRRVLRSGADKVAINTAALRKPSFITEAANKFGSSTIVVSIEAIKQPNGKYLAFTDNGREYTGKDVMLWTKEASRLGAGEILLTSVDQEGTGLGFDIELTKMVCESVDIPVIASGGAGKLEHIKDVILKTNVNAVAIASMLHYEHLKHHKSKVDKEEGNTHFLKEVTKSMLFATSTVPKIKAYLEKYHISCRH